jgi:hypothetical protein
MTEKAVRQLRTNFEKLGARLGENLAGQSYPSALISIWNPERHPLATRDGADWVEGVCGRGESPTVLIKVYAYRAFPGSRTRRESKRLRR